jgi:hypothetical protein
MKRTIQTFPKVTLAPGEAGALVALGLILGILSFLVAMIPIGWDWGF